MRKLLAMTAVCAALSVPAAAQGQAMTELSVGDKAPDFEVLDNDLKPVNLAAYQGKVAALMAASPGALGGLRGLVHVRSILSNIGVLVLPDQIAIPQASKAFDSNGALTDSKQQPKVEALAAGLVSVLARLRAER